MVKISGAHWDRIRHHFPEENIPDERPGRKPVPARRVLDAVLWVLKTGAHWHMLPQTYPNYKTVHRRFQTWAQQEVLRGILVDLANELRDHDLLDTSEC
jgi:transposase